MSKEKLKQQLSEKLDRNMEEYQEELLQSPPELLIEQAGEIHAARMVYEELRSADLWEEQYEYLLRFDNPLELMRDQWLNYLELDGHEEMSHIISELEESDYEKYYDLDPEYAPTDQFSEPSLS